MSGNTVLAFIVGAACGAAVTAGIIAFSDPTPKPVCENEVFTICLYETKNGVFGEEHVTKSGKGICKTYPIKEYIVETMHSPFHGKRIVKRSDPTETYMYKSNDYMRADMVCTDSIKPKEP